MTAVWPAGGYRFFGPEVPSMFKRSKEIMQLYLHTDEKGWFVPVGRKPKPDFKWTDTKGKSIIGEEKAACPK